MGQLIGYARVSTDDQDFTTQIEKLKAAGCTKIFSEKQSGTKRDRPELARALEYVREGDTFVCVKADRVARSTRDFLNIVETLDEKSVVLKVIDQPELNGSGSSGKLLRTMLAAIAEFELSLIRDRMSEGRKRAKGAGVKFGRPRKLDDKTAKLVQGLKRDEKLSVPEISIRTGLSVASVYRALSTRSYVVS